MVRLAVTLLLISFLRLPCIGDKRLVAACETDRAAINKLSVGIYPVLLSAYLMPVSYTHLDVYKRQQLHIYRNGKKILVLAGKAQPKVIREDKLNELITQ